MIQIQCGTAKRLEYLSQVILELRPNTALYERIRAESRKINSWLQSQPNLKPGTRVEQQTSAGLSEFRTIRYAALE